MVRSAATACLLLLLAAPVLAEDAAPPPVVSTEAPALGDAGAWVEAAPLLPGAADPAPPTGTPAPIKADTDLVRLVLKAHPVVQGVMALLALAVAAVLTVLLFKLVEFALAFRHLRRTEAALATAADLFALQGDDPLALASRAARAEVDGLPPTLTAALRAASRDRLDLALDRIEAGAVMRLRSGTGLLASIGAVGPFVGLFGTVFGIMNSFLAIAATQTTSLSVVAPGIAEALLATGIGLVAAIPAVLLYNGVMRRIASYRHRLADGRSVLLCRFSHELDRRMGA